MKFFADLVSMKERIHLFNSILIVFETSLRRQGHNVREVVTINVQIHRISCLQYKQEIYKKRDETSYKYDSVLGVAPVRNFERKEYIEPGIGVTTDDRSLLMRMRYQLRRSVHLRVNLFVERTFPNRSESELAVGRASEDLSQHLK